MVETYEQTKDEFHCITSEAKEEIEKICERCKIEERQL